jgi:short-subunit dehydrogenase
MRSARISSTNRLVGSTGSLRGSAFLSPFATGKFALRALSQSLAREFSPQGVHVSHVVIDGVIDIPRTQHIKFDHPEAKLGPDAVSERILQIRPTLTTPGRSSDANLYIQTLDR